MTRAQDNSAEVLPKRGDDQLQDNPTIIGERFGLCHVNMCTGQFSGEFLPRRGDNQLNFCPSTVTTIYRTIQR